MEGLPVATNVTFTDNESIEIPSRRVQQLNRVLRKESVTAEVSASAMERGNFAAAELVTLADEITQQQPHVSRYRRVAAEAIATFVLVFLGCGSIVVDKKSNGAVTYPGVAFVFGLAIMAMIKAVGHISGAHMNPAITIAFASVREFEWDLVPFYAVAQCGGAIVAAFALRAIFDQDIGSQLGRLGSTRPAGSNLQSFVMESILTGILMFTVCSVAVDTRAVGELSGLILGGTVTVLALVGGGVSGASMNPARSLGPAIASNSYKGLWIYALGPILGGVAGAWLYRIVHGPEALWSESQVRIKSPAASGRLPSLVGKPNFDLTRLVPSRCKTPEDVSSD